MFHFWRLEQIHNEISTLLTPDIIPLYCMSSSVSVNHRLYPNFVYKGRTVRSWETLNSIFFFDSYERKTCTSFSLQPPVTLPSRLCTLFVASYLGWNLISYLLKLGGPYSSLLTLNVYTSSRSFKVSFRCYTWRSLFSFDLFFPKPLSTVFS